MASLTVFQNQSMCETRQPMKAFHRRQYEALASRSNKIARRRLSLNCCSRVAGLLVRSGNEQHAGVGMPQVLQV